MALVCGVAAVQGICALPTKQRTEAVALMVPHGDGHWGGSRSLRPSLASSRLCWSRNSPSSLQGWLLALLCPWPQLGTALGAAGRAEPPVLLTPAVSGSGVQKKEPFWFCKRENGR